MKYERFEDLPVWKAAIELAVRVFELTARDNFKGYGGLRDQIERAAMSVSNNIAEGFERGTTQELLTFLYIARGSAGETRSLLHLLDRFPGFNVLKAEIASIRALAENVSRQLRGWTGSLQNSDIKGQRYLTDKTRQSTKAAQEREEFIEQLRRAQEENIARLQEKNTQQD
jgi:four helix bundle protein